MSVHDADVQSVPQAASLREQARIAGENRIGKGLGKEEDVREGGNEKSDSRSALNTRTLERDSAWVSGEKTGEDTRASAMCASESGTVQLCNGFLILNAAAAAAARNCR